MTITRKDIGKPCIWHGYDDRDYQATVKDIKRGIALIAYYCPAVAEHVCALVDCRKARELAHVEFHAR